MATKEKTVKFTSVVKGQKSGVVKKWMTSVTNERRWQEVWDEHTATQTPKPALPKVDFKKHMIIVVFAGDKDSRGFSVSVADIEESPTGIMVTYKNTDASGKGTTQAFHFVKVKASKKSVNFIEDIWRAKR